MTQHALDALWQRGKDFLGTDYAILGGAMSWVSEHNLVAAISNAGGFGMIAGGGMGPDFLGPEIDKTRALTDKPFGVNLITMHPELNDLIDLCIAKKVSHVALAGGIPPGGSIQRLKDGGIKVICFAPALILAKKFIRSGADALVIEGSEAGGHIGPVSTAVLAQEILPHIKDVPIFIAGGIGRGDMVTNFLRQGASGVQIGTRFVCATESVAHDNFKKAFIRGNARDAVSTVQIDPDLPVIPVRALENKGTRDFMDTQRRIANEFRDGKFSKEEAQLEIEKFWVGALRRAVVDGDVEHGSLMAGQSVGMVKKVEPLADIMNDIVSQAIEAI